MATTVAASSLQEMHDFHPLELIPFFRRWRCGFWRDLLYTFIWNTGLAVLFSILALLWTTKVDLARLLWVNFVYANCVGYAIHALYLVGYALIPRDRLHGRAARVVFYAGIPIVGVIAGFGIGHWLLGPAGVPNWFFSPRGLITLVGNSLLITGLLLAVMIPRERAAKAQARLAAAEREAALAQLKALEAQIEPHFLYNTLAHVASLIDSSPTQARAMLDRLIALLRATAKAGNGGATLGGQADLLRAYLDILAMRMGARLHWTINVPRELADVPLPPALLQPLVENAIKHGLEPKIEGGSIAIAARAIDGRLELTVTDTGRGFGTTTAPIGGSTQLGLAGLKQRLAALYGDAARLTIAENQPSGVHVTLAIPLLATR
jgi:signal transduction histidine kinase